MERTKNQKVVENIENNYGLTEEDIQHLLKSEEDIRMGRVYTIEEFNKHFEERHTLK